MLWELTGGTCSVAGLDKGLTPFIFVIAYWEKDSSLGFHITAKQTQTKLNRIKLNWTQSPMASA